jgi:hypothetical protein
MRRHVKKMMKEKKNENNKPKPKAVILKKRTSEIDVKIVQERTS